MRSCSHRVEVKIEYGALPVSNYSLIEDDMRPENLYGFKNVSVAKKKAVRVFPTEFFRDKIAETGSHKCFKVD